jgi:peptidoglycan-associated lipoprotein
MRICAVRYLSVAALAATVVLGGCHKATIAKATPPPPPPSVAPTVSLTATPNNIEVGQTSQLTWNTQNATEITLEGIGTVPAEGSRTVTPQASTTYQLIAKGPGGTRDADARVTVTEAAKPVAQVDERALFAKNVQDVFFDYDNYGIRADEQRIAEADAQFLSRYSDLKVVIEGHCDERGSEEYNLALGDNRADSMKDTLVRLGVSADRIKTISYGKEKPFCTENNARCWQQNRRDHFALQN